MKKAVIISIIIILTALVADFAFYKFTVLNYKKYCEKNNIKFDNYMQYNTYRKPDKTSENVIYKNFLETKSYSVEFPEDYDKKSAPILLFGDDYVWEYPQIFRKLLVKGTSRPVFNFSYWGWASQHMLYFIENPFFYKTLENEFKSKNIELISPEFAIFVYVYNQKNRQQEIQDYFLDCAPSLEYVIQNEELEKKHHSVFHKILFRSFIYKYLKRTLSLKFQKEEDKYNLMQKTFEKSFRILKSKYPDIKFIILNYNQKPFRDFNEDTMFDNLKRSGIIVINTDELTNKDLTTSDMTGSDNFAPGKKAWETITPEFTDIIFNRSE